MLEILKYCIPAICVLLATWLVMHKFYKSETEKRLWELKKLSQKGKKTRWKSFFDDAESRSDMVATFLAILELTKSKKVKVTGDGEETQIELIDSDFTNISEEWN